jgi:hypothetical protein
MMIVETAHREGEEANTQLWIDNDIMLTSPWKKRKSLRSRRERKREKADGYMDHYRSECGAHLWQTSLWKVSPLAKCLTKNRRIRKIWKRHLSNFYEFDLAWRYRSTVSPYRLWTFVVSHITSVDNCIFFYILQNLLT